MTRKIPDAVTKLFSGMAPVMGLASVVAFGVAGCTTVHPTSTPEQVSQQQMMFIQQPYQIKPGDVLNIQHRLAHELNQVVVVQPDGDISLPLLDPVHAAGHSPRELSAVLEKAYGKDVLDPQVSVQITSYGEQKAFIGGEVGKPGQVDVIAGETVLQGIFAAGGLAPTAKSQQVVVMRYADDSHRMIFPVNLDKAENGEQLADDVILQPLDTVYVPRKTIVNWDIFVSQYLRDALPAQANFGIAYNINKAN